MIKWGELELDELERLKEMYLLEGEEPVYNFLRERNLVDEYKCINCHLSAELKFIIIYANRKTSEISD